jgi:predicted aspartyl protease
MPHLTFPIHKDGLVVEAMIGLKGQATADLLRTGRPIPPPLQLRALVDTGTDATALTGRVFRHLGLSPIRQASTQTATGPVSVNLYEVSLSVSGRSSSGPTLVRTNLLVTELTASLGPIEALIVVFQPKWHIG